MLNGINAINSIGISKPSFKAEEEKNLALSVPKKTPMTNNRVNPMANYGIVLANIGSQLDVKPLIPTIYTKDAVNSIEGDRILDSEGNLHSIVKEDENIKTVYKMSKEEDGMIESIKTYSKKTGKIIRDQENEIENGKYKSMEIFEFSPVNGKQLATTWYKNGKPVYASKTNYAFGGDSTHISRDFHTNSYSVHQEDKNGKVVRNIEFSSDKKTIDVIEHKTLRGRDIESRIKFHEGALISLEETNKITMPNMVGFNPLTDKDLKRAKNVPIKFLEYIIKSKEGEKTNYSNGNLETKEIITDNGKEIKAYFDINGKLEKAEIENQIIRIIENGNAYCIQEKMDNDAKRTTFFHQDGTSSVLYHDGKNYKEIIINKKNMPVAYHEGCEDSSYFKTIIFDEQGVAKNIHTYGSKD